MRAASPSVLRAAPAVLVLTLALPARAAPQLDVAGEVAVEGEELAVHVRVTNRGDQPAQPLLVDGRLLGGRHSATVEDGVPPGESRSVLLRFPLEVERPGVHLADLHLQYPREDGTPTGGSSSQRAYLLVSLGASPPPAVSLVLAPASVTVAGSLRVTLRSADGAAHRVRVRALMPRGVNAVPEGVEVDLPASGDRTVALPLLRAGAPRGSRSGLLVVASALDGPEERTSVATGTVDVAPATVGWMERARPGLLAAAGLLLTAALAFEWRPRRS